MKMILEPRFLFDGSVGATHPLAAHTDPHSDSQPDHHDTTAATTENAGDHAAPVSDPATPAASTLLVVDPRVTNWQSLTSQVQPGVTILVLDPAKDGVAQVTQALAAHEGVQTLEFLTNGAPGQITLGATTLDAAALSSRAGEIAGWSAAFAPNSGIVFWGCDVAAGPAGQNFLADVHSLTGASVGASTDATGAAAQGGNWTLESTIGILPTASAPFADAALASYTGILDTPVPQVTLGLAATTAHTTAGTVLLGDTLNATISFTNAAANATGYGPYVELFTPAALTLNGTPSYNGLALTTLSATVSGGSVLNPLTNLTESAPAGYVNGHLYLVELPYGSVTPGETASGITAQFSMSNSASLVGTTLGVDARGAFEFGAVATGAPVITGTDAAQSATVELVESWATVATVYGEGETATGPDFPVQYTVHLLPAPAVANTATPITNLGLAFDLPSGVTWTGGTPTATGAGAGTVTSRADLGGTVQTLAIAYTSLSGEQSVTVPVYVPQSYQYTGQGHTAAAPILDPASGAPVTIVISPSYTYSADSWNTLPIVNETGDVGAASFVAKSLAVQLGAATGSALPTQDIGYTMTYQVSDYFGLSGLVLNAKLSDGLTFDPTVAPVISVAGKNGGVSGTATLPITAANTDTVNGETIQSSGSGPNVSYAYNGTDGTTAITLNAGAAVPGTFGAGTTGTATFSATVLDKYTLATDQVAGADGFLRQGDSVSVSSASDPAASLYDYLGAATYSASVGTISDFTATPTDTLPIGALTLQVAYVNGVAYTGQLIAPGDTVVYELAYTLPDGGDFAGLKLSAILPEPVFSAIHPTNPDVSTPADWTGSGTANFAASAAAASALTSGTYTSTLSAALAGKAVVTGGTGAEPSNAVSFALASTDATSYLDVTKLAGGVEKITIDFAVTASSLPFVDGLKLTAQANSSFTPATAGIIAAQQIATVALSEPLLTVKQGVVSLADDAGTIINTAPGVSYSGGGSTAPTSLFAPAGSASVFAPGATIPAAISLPADNLDVSGAVAGDTARIVTAVQNTGTRPAYDVIVNNTLPQGVDPTTITNLTFTRGDGTVLTALDPTTADTLTGAAAISAFFGARGVLLTNGGTKTAAVLSGTGSAADIVYITYDQTLAATTQTAASLTGSAKILAWSNQDTLLYDQGVITLTNPVSGTDANFADATALGATLTDTATIRTRAPSLTDAITSGTDASLPSAAVPANTYTTNTATAVPGETMGLRATITLPQGTSTAVVLTDILPAGLTPITSGGSYTVTLHANDGTTTDLTAKAAWSGQTLTVSLGDQSVVPLNGGDTSSTITVDYQAIVPKTSSTPISTASWSSATTGNTTLRDSFAANSEGLAYGTTTITDTTTTSGNANASGLANTITVTNPLVTAALTELGGALGAPVYSGEAITYQLTLTNSSASATAYDLGSLVALPAGMTYVAGSLAQTGGAAATLIDGAVAAEGATPGTDAIAGITLAPGASATFVFQGKVDNNLAAGTTLKASTSPDWTSLPASVTYDGADTVNPQAQAYTGAPATVQNSIATLTPALSIIGSSNNTAGLGTSFNPTGTDLASSVLTTDGEIARMRATLQIPEGQNANVGMTLTLPAGLTFANDGSTKILLVSPNGDTLTTLTGAGLQLAEGGTAIDTTKLSLGQSGGDPVVATLPTSDIAVAGNTATISLGTLANNDNSALPNYVVVEFNAIVANNVADKSSLTTTMTGTANAASTATVSDYINTAIQAVSIAKTITNIVNNPDGSVTVTYTDTVTNTGSGPAYSGSVVDPGAGTGTASYTGTTSGTGTGVSATTSGGDFDATITKLPAGGTQSFTYTVTIPAGSVAGGISDAASKATVTTTALDPSRFVAGQETLAGTTNTPAVASASATAGLDAIAGTVSQDVGATKGAGAPLVGLGGQTVTINFPNAVTPETATTDANGNFLVLVPDAAGTVTVNVAPTGPAVPANDVLDNTPAAAAALTGTGASTTGTNPVTLSFTPEPATSYTNLPFNFWTALDTAPVLAGAPAAPLVVQPAAPQVALFPAATVTDTQLDTNFAHDFSGTTLTLQRTTGADANDSFAGAPGTGVVLDGSGNVTLNGTNVGTYTETGGKLTISFNPTGVTATTVDSVLQGIGYTYTGPATSLIPGITIGAQIDDANNDPIGLNGFTPKTTGPHDQGPGGDLFSNVLTAAVTIQPAGATAAFTEPNDANPTLSAVPVLPLIDLADTANTASPPTGATLTIASPRAEDTLAFTNTAKITGTYTAGTLTLAQVAGQTPSIADWQAAIRSVTYINTSDTPFTTPRTVTLTLTDGAATAQAQSTVSVAPTNDSPILDTTTPPTIAHATEYQGTGTPTPSGPVGTLVSQIVSLPPGNVTDPDGAGLTAGAAATAPGIAITAASTLTPGGTSVGTWFSSTDNGTTWTAFPTTLSAQTPLDLASTARIVFQPTKTDYNGTIPNALTFRAWDGFDGTASGTQATLTGITDFGQNAARNTAGTAYSIATESVPLIVDNVNNAPFAAGTATLPPVSTQDQNPHGDTVAHLFGPGFTDPRDQQYATPGNPAGSLSNPFAGVAITGNNATPAEGTWRYSTDGGTTWSAIPTTVSPTAAVILPAGALVSFRPAPGYSGTPGTLLAQVIDSSSTPIGTGPTGATLAAGTAAYTNINVSESGGSTPISSAAIPLSTLVTPVNLILPAPPADPGHPVANNFPSDLFQDPTFGSTTDYLRRPEIPDLSLVGSIANRFIIVEQHAVIAVPPNVFQDTMDDPKLTYEAKRPDGTPLPSWLSFDPSSLTFQGIPPATAYGRVDVLIHATDAAGRTADATFSILIGRKQDDLLRLLDGQRGPTRLADLLADAGPPADALPIAAKQSLATPIRGFAAALRTHTDTTARARSLLDQLDALARAEPAA